ncbi:related to YMR1-Phosphatidylinositol 3-phosphate phosphatase [Sporisorium reilianum f. sp. reilianum]|uniref:Related to YMR1-Phosphatidylinositol 3-phosphate phosphatase n=1 Tax=Sporisorium reilianum f. sp. reilianum TaxID=72559 RepID=A0A2N8UP60_9BASI|nr:related to YMR1-Phosphatidylinositol 3-phosphate phosphatase [Sporisorium reilianum f. sp. reilianum]
MQSLTASTSSLAASHSSLTPLPKPRVENLVDVWFQRKGETNCRRGSLHLTPHHLIFESKPSSAADSPSRQISIPLSLILKATRIPSLRISAQPTSPSQRIYPITLFYKTFDSAAFAFHSEHDQLAVFDSLKECAILSDVTQLYAFYYQPSSQLHSGRVYDPKSEFARQGLGSRSKAWRFTDINAQYAFCASYPALMAVPSRISDTTLSYAAKYRSKARIPALTYLHWANHASITRSSQPMVGLKNARSIQDEKLIEAIFTSHHFADPESITAKAAAGASSGAAAASASGAPAVATVYGATTTNLIVDARPTTNAMANVAKGAGTENMEYYKGCKKSYLGIENIHVMRDSLNRLTDALRESEPIATFGMRVEALGDASANDTVTDGSGSVLRLNPTPVDPLALRKSMWLKHIQSLMEGSMSIVRNVHINSSHVLIHCSDGWDRTSQLAAIAQICLDPYFRTFDGLAVLIEKDWLSFGHKFTDRSGLKGSDRYFTVASKNSYASQSEDQDDGYDTDPDLDKANAGGGGFDGQAAANAFWGFTKQLTANFSAATSSSPAGPKKGSNIKETSPVFHQFLDCMWQIMRQFPERFEYDSAYLVELHQAIHECKYGTFLMDSERERLQPHDSDGRMLPALPTRTVSAWTHLLSPEIKTKHRNPRYQPTLDDRDPKRKGTDMGVLIADSRDVRYFEQLFQRATGDMNAALDKEADERRRARERLERAVRGSDAASASTEALKAVGANGASAEKVPGGGELEKADATIAVVGANDADPVLNPLAAAVAGTATTMTTTMAASPSKAIASSPAPGAVDLTPNGQVDPARLSYQARQPRSRVQQSAGTASLGSASNDAAADSPMAMASNVSSAADAAANKMKNLFIGGWGRLQEAMAAPASEASPLSNDTLQTAPRPASPAKPLNTSVSTGAASAHPSNQHPLGLDDDRSNHQTHTYPGLAPSAHAAHNPWAVNAGMRAEMQCEHVAMRAPYGHAGATNPNAVRPGFGAGERQQSWSASAYPSSNGMQGVEESKDDGKQGSSSAVTSDPLGVL